MTAARHHRARRPPEDCDSIADLTVVGWKPEHSQTLDRREFKGYSAFRMLTGFFPPALLQGK